MLSGVLLACKEGVLACSWAYLGEGLGLERGEDASDGADTEQRDYMNYTPDIYYNIFLHAIDRSMQTA